MLLWQKGFIEMVPRVDGLFEAKAKDAIAHAIDAAALTMVDGCEGL